MRGSYWDEKGGKREGKGGVECETRGELNMETDHITIQYDRELCDMTESGTETHLASIYI